MIELKPCPFCGITALDIDCFHPGGARLDHWTISCQACGSCSGYHTTKARAIEKWNHREAEYIRGRDDMRNEIVLKLLSYDAGKCAQIAASVSLEGFEESVESGAKCDTGNT